MSDLQGVRSWLHLDTSEGSVEKVWVVGDLGVEADGAEGSQAVECDFVVRRHADELVELVGEGLVIVAVFVEIRTAWRGVAFVSEEVVGHGLVFSIREDLLLVVRARDTIAQPGQGSSASSTWGRCATDRPAKSVAIDDGAEDSEESSEIRTHSHDLGSGIDELGDGGPTIVRQEAVVGKSVQTGIVSKGRCIVRGILPWARATN